MHYLLQQLLNALQLGSIYALIALGYTMVYGVLTMINFAHGDVFMVGAFVCLLAARYAHLPFIPVLLICMGLIALLGVTTERLAYRPLRRAPRVSAVITALGVGIFLEHVTLGFSPYPQPVPPLIPTVTRDIGGVTVSSLQVLIILSSAALMILLDWIVRATRFGLAMRAISWNKEVVPLMGIPVNTVIAFTFALGSGLGGAAGVFYAMAYPVINPYMGVAVGWKAFIAAVVGGIGSIGGAVLGGYLLGLLEIMTAAFLPSTFRDLTAFTLLLVLLLFRPHGLIGRRGVRKW